MKPDPTTPLETPDPIFSTEGIAAAIVAVVANAYVLAGTSFSEVKQTALATLITSAWLVGQFVHAAIMRKGRALGNTQR